MRRPIAPTRTTATKSCLRVKWLGTRASCNCLEPYLFSRKSWPLSPTSSSCRQHQSCPSGFLKIFTASVCHPFCPLFVVIVYPRWSVTSLRGPGERNFNAASHKPKLTGTDWIELNWCARWFMGYGIKISFPRPLQWRHRSPGHEAWIFAQFSVRQGWTTEPVVDSVAGMFLYSCNYLSGEIRGDALNCKSFNKYWKTRNPGIASCKEIQIPESGKFLLVESGIWEISRIVCFVIRNTAQGIRNPSNDWNPESKFHWQRIRTPVPGIQNPKLSWIPLYGATGTFSSVAFKLLIVKFFCNLAGFVQVMEILESHGI